MSILNGLTGGLLGGILGDSASNNNQDTQTGAQNSGAFDLHNSSTDYSYSDQNTAASSSSHDIGGSFGLTDLFASSDHGHDANSGGGLLGIL